MEVSIPHLLACAVIVYLLTLGTFGSAVPCGLFIPHILCGAILGRAFGEAALQLGFDVHPGVYALVGSTGMLSGFSRMTISLAMIMLEITNSMRMLEDDLTEDRVMVLENLAVHDACTSEVVALRIREKTEHIVSLLMQSSFAGYPVVDSADRLVAFVTRSRLVDALTRKLERMQDKQA